MSKGAAVVGSPEEYVAILMKHSTKLTAVLFFLIVTFGRSPQRSRTAGSILFIPSRRLW